MNRFDNKAHTLTELILASVITVMLMGSAIGAYVFTKQIYASSIARANLQRDADTALKKIMKGRSEPAGVFFRPSEAQKFSVVNLNKLEFWGIDNDVSLAATRWYDLDGAGTSILYHHPGGAGVQVETIYTAPAGAALTLWFDQDTDTDAYIGVAISQNVGGQNISGSATAMVNSRNHT